MQWFLLEGIPHLQHLLFSTYSCMLNNGRSKVLRKDSGSSTQGRIESLQPRETRTTFKGLCRSPDYQRPPRCWWRAQSQQRGLSIACIECGNACNMLFLWYHNAYIMSYFFLALTACSRNGLHLWFVVFFSTQSLGICRQRALLQRHCWVPWVQEIKKRWRTVSELNWEVITSVVKRSRRKRREKVGKRRWKKKGELIWMTERGIVESTRRYDKE